LLAGVSRYPPLAFLMYSIVGRALWTTAYVGLGYSVGSDLDAAAGFLQNLTGFLASLAILAGLGLAAFGQSGTSRPSEG